jgi:hypothetical protein
MTISGFFHFYPPKNKNETPDDFLPQLPSEENSEVAAKCGHIGNGARIRGGRKMPP